MRHAWQTEGKKRRRPRTSRHRRRDIQRVIEEKHFDIDAAKAGEETEFSRWSQYEEKGTSDEGWRDQWERFERLLKIETRFFSRDAERTLASVFNGIEKMRSADGRPLVVDAGSGLSVRRRTQESALPSGSTHRTAASTIGESRAHECRRHRCVLWRQRAERRYCGGASSSRK
jgi:hypothetical protein